MSFFDNRTLSTGIINTVAVLTIGLLAAGCAIKDDPSFRPLRQTAIDTERGELSPAEKGVAGTYQSSVVPAQGPGRSLSLKLNRDRSAEMVTDYMNGTPIVVEKGSWWTESDGMVKVRLSELDGRPLDNNIILKRETDSLLVATEYDRSVYGADEIRLVRR